MAKQEVSFQDKTLLITGGTGSFGNAVVRRFLKEGVAEIRIFSRDEKKQEDMRVEYRDPRLKFYLGDVRDFNSISGAMRGVHMVFCAAALKQVPSCEFHPMEAVYTNVLGTENTLNAAIHHGVEHVIVLSTDKAVYPINAMGMSKALMEKVAAAKSRDLPPAATTICITRYGNVMASRGSVIPLFVQQIKAGQPLTITDPEMTRYMMSLEDAVDLVLYAFRHGRGGDTLVQKAPAVTIGQLATALKSIFKSTSPITIIGTRHGEKKHEALLTREEMIRAEDRAGYYRIPSDARDLNYAIYTDMGEHAVTGAADYTSENTRRLSDSELVDLLMSLEFIQNELRTIADLETRAG
ncbi:UDP-glucose 4-epimerase [Roseimicrobium gellanilyticum]|uniref:UDP-glucose 4-epimerase n=1 Tax=Roseimicrobium gellanilyticum TaxID=748857 RepID=A0A366HSB9_9BACT|nr:polysaccharide biosynthesis protein [Roseimicrobium gellanilyticum]RBP46159.1 UDP-glucose 4-epimerase [Roseimicrobium gellanilyticum]